MAAPPWCATDSRTLHWNLQGNCDHQWPIGRSPQSPGNAVHSRDRVAPITWQPPLTCHGSTDPPLEFARGAWSSMTHWSFSTVPRERCALKRQSGSLHMAAPPDGPRTRGPSIYIRTGVVIINGLLTWRQSPQGMLCTLESPKSDPCISPPDAPIPTGQGAFEASLQAPATCQKWARQLQRRRRQSASKSKSPASGQNWSAY